MLSLFQPLDEQITLAIASWHNPFLNAVLTVFTYLGTGSAEWIALILTLCVMARLHEWGQHDLPAASTAVGSARRYVTAAAFVIVIALCWLALLATEDAAVFAYFQF